LSVRLILWSDGYRNPALRNILLNLVMVSILLLLRLLFGLGKNGAKSVHSEHNYQVKKEVAIHASVKN